MVGGLNVVLADSSFLYPILQVLRKVELIQRFGFLYQSKYYVRMPSLMLSQRRLQSRLYFDKN